MDTVLLQIKNDKAYKLIQDLEALSIVKILGKDNKPKENLHKRFRSFLNLTDEEFEQSVIDGRGNSNNS